MVQLGFLLLVLLRLVFHVHAFYYNRERKIKEETYSQSGVLVKVNL